MIHVVTFQADFILDAIFFTDRPNFHFRASMIFSSCSSDNFCIKSMASASIS
nr:MAG TPA: hypothetical protein [Caudoviricetes sp.]